MVSTLKLTKIQIPNSDSDVISLDASSGNVTLNKTLGGTSITIQGEGTATTNLQQGLVKCWLRMNGTGTPAINDSFNVTSITDQATGNYRVTIANDMGNANYSAVTGAGGAISNQTLMNCSTPGDALGAGTIDLDLQYAHVTANDPEIVSLSILGDLA
tara:strand:+ start:420 stop:893 length:474 start_codon:yes stop_codon:yes gene_type:complete